jgi:GntR family transcriptional repressor for pyruvate dehydrogenase complex
MYEDRRKTVKHANYLRKMAGMHRAIFRAIRARDPIEARTLMEDHLRAAQTAQNLEPQTGRKAAHGTPESCKITKASTKSQKQLPGQQLVS